MIVGAITGYLGAELTQTDDRLVVKNVYAGSPAYDQGLNAGDQIVEIEIRAPKAETEAQKDFYKKMAEVFSGQ